MEYRIGVEFQLQPTSFPFSLFLGQAGIAHCAPIGPGRQRRRLVLLGGRLSRARSALPCPSGPPLLRRCPSGLPLRPGHPPDTPPREAELGRGGPREEARARRASPELQNSPAASPRAPACSPVTPFSPLSPPAPGESPIAPPRLVGVDSGGHARDWGGRGPRNPLQGLALRGSPKINGGAERGPGPWCHRGTSPQLQRLRIAIARRAHSFPGLAKCAPDPQFHFYGPGPLPAGGKSLGRSQGGSPGPANFIPLAFPRPQASVPQEGLLRQVAPFPNSRPYLHPAGRVSGSSRVLLGEDPVLLVLEKWGLPKRRPGEVGHLESPRWRSEWENGAFSAHRHTDRRSGEVITWGGLGGPQK